MAASEKTAVLGLSLWAGTDKPRRADFVSDNTALETLVGGHLGDSDLHLDETRRTQLDEPFTVRTYTGNGAESRRHLLSFSPRAVLVFAAEKGAAEYTGAYTKLYAACWADGQASRGISVSGTQPTVLQEAAPEAGGSAAALNENGVSYVLVAFR